ncbi:NAD(P)-binding protein [Thozetella sp. PMI_491]|nr:NAD(P)-binding protein [Thozetella sp. PMI_491]
MPETVLVTGASGYVAAHIINVFLAAGYHVRGTVRSESSAQKVKEAHPEYADALSFAIVPDLAAPGAVDEAVKGVDGVIHTASPFVLNAKDFDKELFEPAKNGTLFVLQAVHKYNPSVKRIVITSSFASLLDFPTGTRPGYTYSEKDWNPMTTEEAKEKGPVEAYLVSKVIAERAAFDYVEKEKPNFSIATLTPPMVFGPLAQEFSSMSKLNESSGEMWALINGSAKEIPPTGFYAYVDVRDLARAHLEAYRNPAAANQRYLTAGGPYTWQLFANIIREKFPELRDTTPEGNTTDPAIPVNVYTLDTSKVQKELGIEFLPVEKTVIDTINSLKALEKKVGSA